MAKKELTEQERNPEKFFITPKGHKRDRIIINESLKIPKEGQFISLNGYGFLARPGVPIDLPRPVRLMLDTRIETETSQDDNGKNYTRNIPRITYTLIKEDVTAEDNIVTPEDETWPDPPAENM